MACLSDALPRSPIEVGLSLRIGAPSSTLDKTRVGKMLGDGIKKPEKRYTLKAALLRL